MRTFLFLSVLLLPVLLKAQVYTSELGTITGVEFSKDLPKGFDLSLKYQFRSDEDIKQIKGSYFYSTISYRLIKKHLYTEFEYRYTTSFFKDRHRFGLGLIGKYKLHKVTFSEKLTYQREHEYFNRYYEEGHEPTDYLRNKIQAKWHFKKHWDTYLSFETFFKFSNKENEVDEVRLETGINWEFVKHHEIEIYYRIQPEVNQSNPKLDHVIGLEYEWELPKFKKKKDKHKK